VAERSARHGIASDDLLDLADQSLYDAKRRAGVRGWDVRTDEGGARRQSLRSGSTGNDRRHDVTSAGSTSA
jgi:hypothetical protein